MSALPLLAVILAAPLVQEPQPLVGAPLPGLSAANRAKFLDGRSEFLRPFTAAEGLGPVFNGASCVECHDTPNAGGFGVTEVTRFGQVNPFNVLGPLGGPLLQRFSIDPANCIEVVPPQATIVVDRITPSLYGVGLLEGIPDSEIQGNVMGQAAGLSGRTRNHQPLEDPNGPIRVGRFGWKSAISTVHSFSVGAMVTEMSVTHPLLMNEMVPQGDQAMLAACDNVPEPEDAPGVNGMTRADHFTNFQRFLAPPPQTPRSGHAGEALFAQFGCADCHRPEYTTGTSPIAALSGRVVRPYSNFLLHDVGSMSDGWRDGQLAVEEEMGTTALWGLVHRGRFIHDGRADHPDFAMRARQAILEHDGEALASRNAFNAASAGDQSLLVAFLGTLGRGEFDADVDNDRDLDDWLLLEPLFTGAGPFTGTTGPQPILPEDPGAVADVDQDGDFDLVEFCQFTETFDRLFSTDPIAVGVTLDLRSAGAATVEVGPGEVVAYELDAELDAGSSDGLAYLVLDLELPGGSLSPVSAPTGPAAALAAMTNPGGFGGRPEGSGLIQLGGAQNTIGNTLAPRPLGGIVPGIAQPGSSIVVGRGILTAPLTPGTYELRVTEARAGVLIAGAGGGSSWPVRRTTGDTTSGLTVVVRPSIGTNYCSANANSTGTAATMSAHGSDARANNDVTLVTASMPLNAFGVFLTSRDAGFVAQPGGSAGNLCLGGSIGRYVGLGQIQNSTELGAIRLPIDLGSVPQPTGAVSAVAGETWRFTSWYRDAVGGAPVSNFADGLELLLQ